MNTGLLFSAFPFISGEGLTLAQMSRLDLAALWELLGDEENFRFSPTGPLADPAHCSRKLLQAEKLFRERAAVMLGIYPDGGSYLAGIFEIYGLDAQVEAATVRFTVSQRFTGRGIATNALRAAVDYLMADIGVHRVQAYALPSNKRGIKVLERCGFRCEGTIREGFYWPDKGIVDLSLYSLLPTDFQRKSGNHVF